MFQPLLAAAPKNILDPLWAFAEVISARDNLLRPPMQTGSPQPLYAVVPSTSSVAAWYPIFDITEPSSPYTFASETARRANTFYVNLKADTADASIGDGKCDTILSTTDEYECSLRAAIQEANYDHYKQVIVLPGWTFELSATLGTLDISENVVIVGRFADRTIIKPSASTQIRVFRISNASTSRTSTVEVHLINLTVQDGVTTSNGNGGGLLIEQSADCTTCPGESLNVTLDRVRFVENTAAGNGNGGGIHAVYSSTSTTQKIVLTIKNSLFKSNTAAKGGAISVDEEVKLTIENSTIAQNQATDKGGGLRVNKSSNHSTTVEAKTQLTHLTMMYNTATNSGAGILTEGSAISNSRFVFKNTVIANNIVSSTTANCDLVASSVDTDGESMSDDSSCQFDSGDHASTEPEFETGPDPLQNAGGTEAYIPIVDSNVLDEIAGSDCVETDQRGVRRPRGSTDTCDIGAFEVAPMSSGAVDGSAAIATCGSLGCLGENYAPSTQGVPMNSDINSRTGNVMDYVTDLVTPSTAGPIPFSRSYSSLNAQVYATASPGMPLGWNHNYHVRIDGDSSQRTIFMPDGSRVGFSWVASEWVADAGVNGTLTEDTSPDEFIYTSTTDMQYIFDNESLSSTEGMLKRIDDGMGHVLVMDYDGGTLLRYVYPQGGGSSDGLTLNYNTSNQLTSVTGAGRTVSYTYDSSSPYQLLSVTDVTGNDWDLEYHPDYDNLLLKRFAPGQSTPFAIFGYDENTTGNPTAGRASSQTNGLGDTVLDITEYDLETRMYNFTNGVYDFNSSNPQNPDATEFTHQYNTEEALARVIYPGGENSYLYNPNYRLSQLMSGNSIITDIGWSADSADMTAISNTMQEGASYNYDKDTHLLQSISYPDGSVTWFVYNHPNLDDDPTTTTVENLNNSNWSNRVVLRRIDNFIDPASVSTIPADANLVTEYEYTNPPSTSTDAPVNLLARVKPPTDVDTCYSYDGRGQVTHVRQLPTSTASCTSSSAIVTFHDYEDSAPYRLESITEAYGTSSARTTFFDHMDNDLEPDLVIENYDTTKTDYQNGIYNIKTRIFRNERGQVVAVVKNYNTTDFTGGGQPIDQLPNDVFPSSADVLEVSTTQADHDFNQITKFEYDFAGQVVEVIENYEQSRLANNTDPHLFNRRTHYFYDVAGQVTAIISNYRTDNFTGDTNWQPESIDFDGAGLRGAVSLYLHTTFPQYNQIVWNKYDTAGRLVEQTVNYNPDVGPAHNGAYNLTTLYKYNADNYVVYTIRNYYDQLPEKGTSTSFTVTVDGTSVKVDPDQPDLNIITCIERDSLNRPHKVREGCLPTYSDYEQRGGSTYNLVSRFFYDINGRPVARVRNYDLTGSATLTDGSIRLSLTEVRNLITRIYYDGMGRVKFVEDNFSSTSQSTELLNDWPVAFNDDYPDRNLITKYDYNSQGFLKATIINYADLYPTTPPLDGIITEGDITEGLPQHLNLVMWNEYDVFGRQGQTITNFEEEIYCGNTCPSYNSSTPDRNLVTDYTYDSLHRPVTATLVRGIGAGNNRITEVSYDRLDRVSSLVDNKNGAGHADVTTTYSYSQFDLVEQVIRQVDQTASRTRTETMDYDNAGRLTAHHVDPSGLNLTTSYIYDAANQVTQITNPAGEIVTASYDVVGRVIKTTRDPDSNVSNDELIVETRYDAMNRVVEIEHEDNTVTRYEYTNTGWLKVVFENYLSNQTDSTYPACNSDIDGDNVCTYFEYNAAGHLFQMTLPNNTVTRYQYDALGRLRFEWVDPGQDGTPTGADYQNIVTEYCYTPLGVVKRMLKGTYTGYTVNWSTMTLSGSQCETSDSSLNAEYVGATYTYDGMARVTAINYRNRDTNSPFVDADDVTSITYDAWGNRNTMSDGLGSAWDFNFDSLNRPSGITDPWGNAVSYQHYLTGERKQLVASDGVYTDTINYTIDNAGRLTDFTNPFVANTTVHYQYTSASRNFTVCNVWQSIACAGFTTTYTFDKAGRLDLLQNGTLSTFDYKLDLRGNRTDLLETLTYPMLMGMPGMPSFGGETLSQQHRFNKPFDAHSIAPDQFADESGSQMALDASFIPAINQPTVMMPTPHPKTVHAAEAKAASTSQTAQTVCNDLALSTDFAEAMNHEDDATAVDASVSSLTTEQSTYQATFTTDGVQFEAMEGEVAVADDIQLEIVTTNAEPSSWQMCDNLVFRSVKENLIEVISTQDDGIQLGYLLETNPLSPTTVANLNLKVDLNTELQPRQVPDGWVLLDGENEGIHISQAFAFDSAGQQIPLNMSIENGQLVMSVPNQWLAEATFPVLVDPMIVRWSPSSGHTHDNPSIAFDATETRALIAYVDYHSTYSDIRVRMVDVVTGQSLSDISLFDNGTGGSPAVVYNPSGPSGAEYLVGYFRNNNSLRAWRIDADTGQKVVSTSEIMIYDGSGCGSFCPTWFAGLDAAIDASSGQALFVRKSQLSGNQPQIYGYRIAEDGTGITSFTIAGSQYESERSVPRVTFDEELSKFLVVWKFHDPGDQGESPCQPQGSLSNAHRAKLAAQFRIASSGIRSRTVPTSGTTMGTEVYVNGDVMCDHTYLLDVAYSAVAGKSLIVWSNSNGSSGRPMDNGTLQTAFTIGPSAPDIRVEADKISGTGRGGWITTWYRYINSTNQFDISMVVLPASPSGNYTSSNLTVRATTANETQPVIQVRSDGVPLIAYHTTGAVELYLNPNGLVPDLSWRYTYDKLMRLTSACSIWVSSACKGDTFTYTYDGAGNVTRFDRWNETTQAVEALRHTYNTANQLTQTCVDTNLDGGCSGAEQVIKYQYDIYGNLVANCLSANWNSTNKTCNTGYEITKYTYDGALRTKSVKEAGTTYTYTYNGDGERVQQKVDAGSGTYNLTTYILDLASAPTMVLSETTKTYNSSTNAWISTAPTIRYLYGHELVAQLDGTTLRYFANDGLGSVRQIVSISGGVSTVQRAQTHDPFGNLYVKSGNSASTFGFTGEQTDANGLVFLRSRYYDPSIGVFPQRDTFRGSPRTPQSLNPYAYVHNNPVRYVDPTGMFFQFRSFGDYLKTVAKNVVGVGKFIAGGINHALKQASEAEFAPDKFGADIAERMKRGENPVEIGAAYGEQTRQAMASGRGFNPIRRGAEAAEYVKANPNPIKWGQDLANQQNRQLGRDIAGLNDAIGIFNRWINAGPVGREMGRPDTSSYYAGRPDRYYGDLTQNTAFVVSTAEAIAGPIMASRNPCRMNSFTADTPVATEDGDKQISEVEEGDEVLAYNEETGEVGEYTVTDAFWHVDKTIIVLVIDGETIYTTPEHPFYTDDGEWKNAEDVFAGEKIRSSDGSYGTVTSTRVIRDANQPMYNLTVDEAHTFFVGEGQWLVHNETCGEFIYRLGEDSPRSTSLYSIDDYETGLSFVNKPRGNNYLKYRVQDLKDAGFIVRPDGNSQVTNILTGQPWRGYRNATATFGDNHVSIWLDDSAAWSAWHSADHTIFARFGGEKDLIDEFSDYAINLYKLRVP